MATYPMQPRSVLRALWAPALRKTARTLFVVVLAVGCALPASGQETLWPTEGWTVSAPEAQGLNDTPLTTLDKRIRNKNYGHVDRMVVVRNGRLVVNARYRNDYPTISWQQKGPLGCGMGACSEKAELNEYNYLYPDFHPYYQGRDIHTIQSITKSVTSALIGIAIRRGEIDGVDVPVLPFFDDYDLSGVNALLHQATLADLLTMRLGIEWHEMDRPLDETNTTLQLERSDDWIQFTLDQPLDADPGERWVYNSGGSHLMSGIIKKATGQYADAYAEAHLFAPLGIDDYHWKKTPKGFPDTEGGLYLEAEDLAKIGYLYLHGGVWDGERILPEGWVEASTARHVKRAGPVGWGYGYQWWRLDRHGVIIWAGLGFGGQFLVILPEYDLIGVINSWNVFDSSPQLAILDAFLKALLASVDG